MAIVRLSRVGVVHQFPSLCQCIYNDKGGEMLVCFVRPARCSTLGFEAAEDKRKVESEKIRI